MHPTKVVASSKVDENSILNNFYFDQNSVSLKLNEVFFEIFKNNGKNYKNCYNFFSYGGILDMLFYATWETIGDNAAWRIFFHLKT